MADYKLRIPHQCCEETEVLVLVQTISCQVNTTWP